MKGEDEWRERGLVEVEVAREVAEDRNVLADGWARVGPAVGCRIEALPTEDRRRPYRLTAAGVRELEAQVQHMRSVANLAAKRVQLITRTAGA